MHPVDDRQERYDEGDILRLFASFPCVSLNQESGSLSVLRRHARSLEIWGKYLPHYRSLRCQPLDFSYRWLLWLEAATDDALVNQLLQHYTWRGKVIAAWLTIMHPVRERRVAIVKAATEVRYPFALDLARHVLDDDCPGHLTEHFKLVRDIGEVLRPIPKPRFKLRLGNAKLVTEVRETIVAIYKARGADAAHAYLTEMAARTGYPLVEKTSPSRLSLDPPTGHWYWAMSV